VIFGSPDVTTGGNALKFYASVRMEIKRTGQVKGKAENEILGNLIRVKVSKNKMAPPFRVADFEMTYGKGVSRSGEVVDLGLASGILGRSGAWYTFLCPKAASAVNGALAAAAAAAASAPSAPPSASSSAPPPTMPASAASVLAGAKAQKGKKRAAAPSPQEEAAPQEAEALPQGGGGGGGEEERVEVGAPFAQGRDKAKAWFEARPAAMTAAAAAVKAALLAGGGKGLLGAAAAPPPGTIAAVGLAAAPLPGVASLEEELEVLQPPS